MDFSQPRVSIIARLGLLVVAGCATHMQEIRPRQMRERLQYAGFSVERPSCEHWFLRTADQSPGEAVFHRDPISDTHTIVVAVRGWEIPGNVTNAKQFQEWVKSVLPSSELLDVQSADFTPDAAEDGWKIQYEIRSSTKPGYPRGPLAFRISGYVCRHPAFPGLCVDVHRSERCRPGEQSQVLWDESAFIFKAVRLESAPGRGAG